MWTLLDFSGDPAQSDDLAAQLLDAFASGLCYVDWKAEVTKFIVFAAHLHRWP
jgi:hypothetical protein